MPDTKQQLGIELSLSLDSKFGDLVKQIENAFAKMDIKGLEDKVKQAEGKVSSLAKKIADTTGEAASDIQKMMNTSADNKAIVTMANQMKQFATITAESSTKVVADFKAQEQAAISLQRQIDTGFKARIRMLTEEETVNRRTFQSKLQYDKEQQAVQDRSLSVLARYQQVRQEILNKNDRRIDGARNTMYNEMGSQVNAGLNAQGYKLYNGSIIPKSYVTDIDKAREAADKYTASLERMSAAERRTALVQLRAEGMNQQLDWNRQAGTSGVKYQPVGGGFVRNTVKVVDPADSQAMRTLRAEADKINSAMGGVKESSNGMFANLTKHLVEFYAIRGALFAVTGEFKTAITTMTEFNQSLHDTAAVANASKEELNAMSEAALQIATHSKFSATEVMHSMKILAQAGVSAADVPTVARNVDMFATGSGSTPEQAARIMTTAMNVWNISAEKSAKITNTLTAALNVSKVEVQDMSNAFNYLANQSALFGKSIEETTALIATLSNQGMEASTIGTSMSQLYARLAAPTPKFKAVLAEYDIKAADISPRMHSMVEIVKTFEEAVDKAGDKGIQVEHIFQGLEARVGRGFASLVQAGSEKLQLMTDRITNTNAAAVAWSESMQGFHAQLNILRSELVTTIAALIGGTGEALTELRMGIQDFIIGLRSSEGQFAIFSTAAVAAIYAIWTAWNSHPIGLALTALGLSLAYITSKVGASNNELAKEIDNSTRAMATSAGEYQRKADSMYKLLELVDKNKVSAEGYLEIQDKDGKQIKQLMNMYPELFKQLDIKKLKYDDLKNAIKAMNEERDKEINGDISSFNREALKLAALKQELASQLEAHKYDQGDISSVNYGLDINSIPAIRNLQQKVQLGESALKTMQSNLAGYSNVTMYTTPSGVTMANRGWFKDEPPKEQKKVDPIDPKAAKDAARLAKREGENIASDNIEIKQAKIKEDEANIADAKEHLKTSQDLLDYQKQATALIKRKYELLDEEDVLKVNKAAATKTKSILKFNADGSIHGVIPDPTVENQTEAKKIIAEEMDRQQKVLDALRAERTAEQRKEQDKVDSTKIPDYKPTSMMMEKMADKNLKTETESLKLQKERVKTAEQLQELNIAEVDAQIKAASMKQEAYDEDELAYKLKEFVVGSLTPAEQKGLDDIREKQKDIVDLLDQQIIKRRELSDNSFDFNFSKGVSKGIVGLGSGKSNTEQLGLDVTNAGLNGMIKLLDTSVTKLKELKFSWKDFASSLGNIMKDIAAHLQTYVVKMMVVWAVEKLVGLVGGSNDPISFGNNSAYGANFINGAFAEGGIVTGGIEGKDSVHLLAQPGEIIVKKSSVDAIGANRLLYANETGKLPKFANGGLVGGSSSSSSSDSGGNLTIINVADVNSIPPATPNENQIVNIVSFAMQKNASFKAQIRNVAQGN